MIWGWALFFFYHLILELLGQGVGAQSQPEAEARTMDDKGKGLKDFVGVGNGNPLQYSCWKISWTEEPHGLQSMGVAESDMT